MESMLSNQVVRFKCPLCTSSFNERIAQIKANPQQACSTCAMDIQIYANQIKADLTRVEQALQAYWQAIDRARAEDWQRLVGKTQG